MLHRSPLLRPAGLVAAALLLAAATPAAAQGYARENWKATLPTLFHDTAATVRIVDENTLQVDNFHFDGGGDGFVYFKLATHDDYFAFLNGLIVGDNLFGQVWKGASLTLDLPPGMTLDGYGAISLWCEPVSANFGSAEFEYPRAGWTADLSTIAHQVDGYVTIVDEDTLLFEDFDYDGQGILVQMYLGAANTNQAFANGIGIGPDLVGMPFQGATFTADLPAGQTLDGWNAISVWCVPAGANFGSGSFESRFRMTPSGQCPGTMRLDLEGATPGGEVALIFAKDLGNAVVPGGKCAGTVLGLGYTAIQLMSLDAASDWGDLILQEIPPAAACGAYLQALDIETCQVSEVVTIQ